jgi:hypothetical protein
VRVQPKGLLATEAFVTIPFAGAYPLAVRSHFFEFLPDDDAHDTLLADELKIDETYRVLVTTAGGLWRHRLGDRVRVDGFVGRTPSLRFVGRDDHVVDRFGEKLSEGFVGRVVRELLGSCGIRARFAMLAPEWRDGGTRYTLFIEADVSDGNGLAASLARRLDDGLRANPHYAYCRDLGQLAPPAVFRARPQAYARYAAVLRDAGARLGDIKPSSLSARDDWARLLEGGYVVSTLSTGDRPSEPLTARA